MLDAILLPIGEGNRILAQDLRRQDRRVDHPDLQGRSRKDEAGHQQRRLVLQTLQKDAGRV
jgi:hypothetical protein